MVTVVSLTSAGLLCQITRDKEENKEKQTSMKRKLFLATIGLAISGAFLVATTTRADDETKSSTLKPGQSIDQGAPGKGVSSISGKSHNFMRTSQLNSQ